MQTVSFLVLAPFHLFIIQSMERPTLRVHRQAVELCQKKAFEKYGPIPRISINLVSDSAGFAYYCTESSMKMHFGPSHRRGAFDAMSGAPVSLRVAYNLSHHTRRAQGRARQARPQAGPRLLIEYILHFTKSQKQVALVPSK